MKYERLTSGILLSDVIKGYDLRDDVLSERMFCGYNVIELIDRLVELENKIEAGTLIEIPKDAMALTSEERAEEMRLANEERKQAVKEFAEKLRDKEFSVKIGAEWCAVVKSLDIDEFVKEV